MPGIKITVRVAAKLGGIRSEIKKYLAEIDESKKGKISEKAVERIEYFNKLLDESDNQEVIVSLFVECDNAFFDNVGMISEEAVSFNFGDYDISAFLPLKFRVSFFDAPPDSFLSWEIKMKTFCEYIDMIVSNNVPVHWTLENV